MFFTASVGSYVFRTLPRSLAATIKAQLMGLEYSPWLTRIDARGYKAHDLVEKEYVANLLDGRAEMLRIIECQSVSPRSPASTPDLCR